MLRSSSCLFHPGLYKSAPSSTAVFRLSLAMIVTSQILDSLSVRLFHVFSEYRPRERATRRRMKCATQSWERERRRTKCWVPTPVCETNRSLDGLPFIRDLISVGIERAALSDIIVLTNADTNFVVGLTEKIVAGVKAHGAVYCHRWDFSSLEFPEGPIEGSQLPAGQWYGGSDLFAFYSEWWNHHGSVFPDMILGREAWDLIMRLTIRRGGGVEVHHAIYHEIHDSAWERPGMKLNPGNNHNLKLARQWIERYGGNWDDWRRSPVFK